MSATATPPDPYTAWEEHPREDALIQVCCALGEKGDALLAIHHRDLHQGVGGLQGRQRGRFLLSLADGLAARGAQLYEAFVAVFGDA